MGFIRSGVLAGVILVMAMIGPLAYATECPEKPDALGTSRTIVVDPEEHTRVGTMQYAETLPLADHEIVLTFDDGPSPRYTDRVLAILAAECVKATFFMVGEMAQTFPAEAKKVSAEGHTVGTHSFRHPFTFNKMSQVEAGAEIEPKVEASARSKAAVGRINSRKSRSVVAHTISESNEALIGWQLRLRQRGPNSPNSKPIRLFYLKRSAAAVSTG